MLLNVNVFGQNQQSPWIKVENKNEQNLRIDVSTIKSVNDSDLYVWALEVHKSPIHIDSVAGKVFKTKTYYLINKPLMKYSILSIMFYDSLNILIKEFNYRRGSNYGVLKYNYPVIPNSPIEAIIKKSLEYIKKGNEKNK